MCGGYCETIECKFYIIHSYAIDQMGQRELQAISPKEKTKKKIKDC